MLPDPSEFDDAARLLDQIGSATDQQAGLARERSSSTAWRSGRADRARMTWAGADGLARTAADELRTAARVLRRIADAVNQLAAGMASARAAEMAQLQQARATAVPGGAVAAQLTERIAGLPPAHDASWARQVGAPALALLQVPAHGPGDPGPMTTPGLVDTDPVAVRGLATVWRTASIEIAAGRVRANQRAVSLPLPALDAYGLPGTRAAELVETSLSPASAVARASLSYQSAAEQAVSAADDIDGLGTGVASWVTSAIAAAVDLLFDSARSGNDGRPTLEEILTRFQVRDDPGGSVEWEPSWPVSLTTEPRSITATEAEMLDRLGLLALRDFRDMADDSFETADARFDTVDRNDDHNDAFRHTYWNALMARRFGEDWAEAYTDAHEGVAGNTAAREAMDLYNNSVGRRLATENPDADAAELADLVEQAVRAGEVLVIGANGALAWSDTVPEGGTGEAGTGPIGPEGGNPDIAPDEDADPDSHNDGGTGS